MNVPSNSQAIEPDRLLAQIGRNHLLLESFLAQRADLERSREGIDGQVKVCTKAITKLRITIAADTTKLAALGVPEAVAAVESGQRVENVP